MRTLLWKNAMLVQIEIRALECLIGYCTALPRFYTDYAEIDTSHKFFKISMVWTQRRWNVQVSLDASFKKFKVVTEDEMDCCVISGEIKSKPSVCSDGYGISMIRATLSSTFYFWKKQPHKGRNDLSVV